MLLGSPPYASVALSLARTIRLLLRSVGPLRSLLGGGIAPYARVLHHLWWRVVHCGHRRPQLLSVLPDGRSPPFGIGRDERMLGIDESAQHTQTLRAPVPRGLLHAGVRRAVLHKV
jgi:hypothetical protein